MTAYADRIDMQNRLFAELSSMFGKEVPLYDKSLLVNQVTNRAVCDLLAQMFPGFSVSDAQLEKTSSERHGAIRIGRNDEYRWIARFFACFAMEPHNYYDMTDVGAKSQPIVATAFRSTIGPEHRVFTSLLQTDYFDDETRSRIEDLLSTRQVFPDGAKQLIEKCESQGGLTEAEADELIRHATDRIFKWTGSARDHKLYTDLCEAGFKIAADIACFESHHLNHLTPNTLCMDLYTAAMRRCMGEMTNDAFRQRAEVVLRRFCETADHDYLRLSFKHLSADQINSYERSALPPQTIKNAADAVSDRLSQPDLDLTTLNHSGFKDSTEGPSWDTPLLLRQDAYKALTEPVRFTNPDGTTVDTVHTARFGEIEQRFYATTPEGRDLYDRCLASAEAAKAENPTLAKTDLEAYETEYASHFAEFPKTLPELLRAGLVYALYTPTDAGRAAAGSITTTDIHELVEQGYADYEGLRYEDFLPVSAAGIFASNLNQYGTKSTATTKPTYTRAMLEDILGRPIIDTDAVYRGLWAKSLLDTYGALGLLDRLDDSTRTDLQTAVDRCPAFDNGQVAARA
ncbi:MAG: 2-oxoadipate dioxygenase/decarboxylase family protein [Phycisphaerales bacterium JB050]